MDLEGVRCASARLRLSSCCAIGQSPHERPPPGLYLFAGHSEASARFHQNEREIAKFRAWGFAVRGRKPKPAALRLLEGNPGRRPIRDEVQPRYGAPARPRFLNIEARREWDRLAPEMARLKLLTTLDGGLFTAYCVVWGHWVECERVISAQGMTQTSARGIVRIRPEARLALRYADQLRGIVSDFGMNPTSRTRLDVHVDGADPDEDLLG